MLQKMRGSWPECWNEISLNQPKTYGARLSAISIQLKNKILKLTADS